MARYAMQPANPLALFKSAGRVAMTGPTPGAVETKRVLFLEYFQSVRTKINDLWQIFLRDKAVQYALSLILASNIFFILLHVFARFMVKFGIADNLAGIVDLNSPLFRIDYDLSFGEFFNYAQTVACAAFLLGVSRITMQPVYRAWAMIFIFVVLDDALKIHEELGHKLSDTFHIGALPGLRAQDTGELLIWAAAGVVLLSMLWRDFVRSTPGARAAGAIVGLAFAALLFFAIGMDMLHVVLGEPGTLASPLLAVIEDGGEMLSIGLACTLALLLYRHPAAAH